MNIPRFQVYNDKLNIDLFNETIALAFSTTENAKLVPAVRERLCSVFWYKETKLTTYFEESGIRYLGELLERYGEHLGDTLHNLRALAAAVAWIKPVMTDSMFVGRQKSDFIEKLRQNIDDPYIAASLYMLAEEDEHKSLRQKLLTTTYRHIEEAIYSLSVLQDCPDALSCMRTQLIRLLGCERSLPIEGNIGLIAWMIHHYRDDILSCRKKENALLRAFIHLNDSYVREKDSAYRILSEAGYSHREILAANSLLVWEHTRNMPGLNPDSIPAEKLATAYVAHCLNGNELPSEFSLGYISELLKVYQKFEIRYEGYECLWDAVASQLDIQCPEIMIWMIETAQLNYPYSYDVLDRKWDVLSSQIEFDRYHKLFRDQLFSARSQDSEHIRLILARYQELTGHDYLENFDTYDSGETKIFSVFVDNGLLNLWEHFQNHLDSVADQCSYSPNRYIWEYARDVSSQYAFEFWKMFFTQYTYTDVPKFWTRNLFHENFLKSNYSSYSPYNYSLRYLRPVLSSDDNRMLLDWIDQSVFTTSPNQYVSFVLNFLRSEDTGKLYSIDELRPVYASLRHLEPNNAAVNEFRQRFLKEEELEQERLAAEAAHDAQKRRAWEKALEEKRTILSERYDGSYQSLVKMLNSLYDWNDAQKHGAICIAERFTEFRNEHPRVSLSEYGCLLALCSKLIGYDLLDKPTVLDIIQTTEIIEPVKEEMTNADA